MGAISLEQYDAAIEATLSKFEQAQTFQQVVGLSQVGFAAAQAVEDKVPDYTRVLSQKIVAHMAAWVMKKITDQYRHPTRDMKAFNVDALFELDYVIKLCDLHKTDNIKPKLLEMKEKIGAVELSREANSNVYIAIANILGLIVGKILRLFGLKF